MPIPHGYFENVYVTPLPGSSGQLCNGNGTSNYSGTVFCCGPFEQDNKPQLNHIYNIKAVIEGEQFTFLGQCFHVDHTSDFDVLPLPQQFD